MITQKILLDNGYRKYSPNKMLSKYSDAMYQKSVSNKLGIKYHINIYHYPPYANISDDSYMIDIQFESKKGYTCNIELFAFSEKFLSLKSIEKEVSLIWKTLKFEYYEKIITKTKK